jgi:hypothetical protein
MMIMVYAHPIVSFLRNFKRERKVPKMAVLSTWNSVYGNIDTYKSKLGDNFVMYQAPDEEFAKEIGIIEYSFPGSRNTSQLISDANFRSTTATIEFESPLEPLTMIIPRSTQVLVVPSLEVSLMTLLS